MMIQTLEVPVSLLQEAGVCLRPQLGHSTIFVLSEEIFLLQLQQEMYWLLLFIPKTAASVEFDVDVRGSILVR